MQIMELALSEIVMGKSNVRVQGTSENIDELAHAIRTHGLLEPIVVFKNKTGKYEVLAGQRRVTAVKSLGHDKIWCVVRTAPVEDGEAKSISLIENITQTPMSLSDTIDACTSLFERYGGDSKLVSEKCGLSVRTINKYVKFARLPEFLKKSIRDGELGMDQKKALKGCIRSIDALQWTPNDGEEKNEKVLNMVKKLTDPKKTTDETLRLYREVSKDPTRPLDKSEEASKSAPDLLNYKIRLSENYSSKLKSYSEQEGIDLDEGATNLVIESLDHKIPSD